MLHYTVLYCTIPYYSIQFYSILRYTILSYTKLYCTIRYNTFQYYTIPCYTILCYTKLYHIVLYCTVLPPSASLTSEIFYHCSCVIDSIDIVCMAPCFPQEASLYHNLMMVSRTVLGPSVALTGACTSLTYCLASQIARCWTATSINLERTFITTSMRRVLDPNTTARETVASGGGVQCEEMGSAWSLWLTRKIIAK